MMEEGENFDNHSFDELEDLLGQLAGEGDPGEEYTEQHYPDQDRQDQDWTYTLNHRELRLRDITWRLDTRPKLAWFLVALLIAQNIVVFKFLWWAFASNRLGEFQVVLPIVITATLAETAFMVKEIVKLIFKDVEYFDKNPDN